jgi:rubrerythrin
VNRRAFLVSAAVAAPAVATLAGSRTAAAQGAEFRDDADILNYALVAEYFLSQFYREASGTLAGRDADYLSAIGADEDAHIAALTQTIQNLGREPVQAPAIDYGDALQSRSDILAFALRFENLFAGAYLGAAAYVRNKDILQAAAGIFGTEERHAAIVANLLGLPAEGGVYVGAVDRPETRARVEAAIEPFLVASGAVSEDTAITL